MQNRGLQLNGIYYSESDLIAFCQEKILHSRLEWEKDCCDFILEWLSASESIVAHTSGSTGKPKKIVLQKQKMKNSARLTGEFFQFRKDQKALLCLSTKYIAGKMMMVRAFEWGLNLITVAPDGHPLKCLNEKIDFAAMIPLQVKNSLQEANLNVVHHLLIGGGAVDEDLEEQLQELTTRCYSSYGMTETVSHVAIRSINGSNRSDYFRGLSQLTFTLDHRACLCIDAPEVVDEKLITNDVVELKNKQEFKWLGRYDHVVNSGGIKLFPEQIEKKLKKYISEDFFLAGVADHHLGEKLILLVEGEDSEELKKKIHEQIKSLLEKYEQAREIIFISQFLRTETGKIQREATLSEKLSK